ncbi:uncharacterized protein LOC142885153 isoform X2 [Nelusetta ayraudi]|uniref:uncharacterized protein LOC142885153 isoform X2 n=1 Tax=Nelusetta ayraudi TaxID=303726 RepID=UPI003F7117F7
MDSTTAAVSKAESCKPHPVEDNLIPEEDLRSFGDLPFCFTEAAGILRYKRECDMCRLNPPNIPPGKALTFCCAKWQELYEILEEHRCDLRPENLTFLVDEQYTAIRLPNQNKEMDDLNSELPGIAMYKADAIKLPVVKTFAPASKVLRFRLSNPPNNDCWYVFPASTAGMFLEVKDMDELFPHCDHIPHRFGMCHQDRTDFRQKNFSSGTKFLIVFPDGSAQIFYPSGHLAVLVVVTGENKRLCIVYEDDSGPHHTIRAIFHSDGRGTCYYGHGTIWLNLNRSGGLCLDEKGAKICRWCWSTTGSMPTPLHPIFLSLNRNVGVRVLGRNKVFVTFLASGQQAKISVGSCCPPDECLAMDDIPRPSMCKEELFVLAVRVRFHLAFHYLQLCVKIPTYPRPPMNTQSPHLLMVSKRILTSSAHILMGASDRAFIYQCLQDCL